MKIRLITIGAGLVLLLAAALVAINLNEFADVPCQDGHWDTTKKTCIPD